MFQKKAGEDFDRFFIFWYFYLKLKIFHHLLPPPEVRFLNKAGLSLGLDLHFLAQLNLQVQN